MKPWRSPAYRKLFQFWPCCLCGCPSSEAAHVRIGMQGIGMKPGDDCCVPLCSDCHRLAPYAQHKGNEQAFWDRMGIDPVRLASEIHALHVAGPANITGPMVIEHIEKIRATIPPAVIAEMRPA